MLVELSSIIDAARCAVGVQRATVSRRLVCLLARIVSRVDVVNAPRPDELNLDVRLLVSRPNIMRVFCRVCEEGPRLGQRAFFVEFFHPPTTPHFPFLSSP